MSTRLKLVIYSALITASFLCLLGFISSYIIMQGFYRIEHQDTVNNVARARDALLNELDRLYKFAGDYSMWDDTYAFIEDLDPKYVDSNLNETTYSNSKINMLAYLRLSGEVVCAQFFDGENGGLVKPSESILAALRKIQASRAATEEKSVKGFLREGDRLLMVAGRPIMKTEGAGPCRGMVFAARVFDAASHKEFEQLTRLSFKLYPNGLPRKIFMPEATEVRQNEPNVVSGYTALADIFGAPSLVLQVDLPRSIYRQGLISRSYLLTISMGLFTLFIIVCCFLYKKIVSQQTAIAQTEHRFSQITQATPDAIVLATETGHIVFWNNAAEKMFGYARDEIIGQPWYRLLWDDSAAGDAGAARIPFRAGQLTEFAARRKDGASFPVEASFAQWAQGSKNYFGTIVRDISERKRTTEELLRSNSDLEQYAYIASHDLQEPLRQIYAMSQLLGQRHGGTLDEKALSYLNFMADGAGHLSKIVRDLLAYSRLNSAEEVCEPVSCRSALDCALANLKGEIARRNLQITHDELPAVSVRPGHLIQLFQNLIDNGMKFQRAGVTPQIHIGVQPQGDGWFFRVTDNGIGIDPAYAEKIFLLFQRLQGRRNYPGTGMGLAICKKIVEQHGGRIWVESEEGRGASFLFTLPGWICTENAS